MGESLVSTSPSPSASCRLAVGVGVLVIASASTLKLERFPLLAPGQPLVGGGHWGWGLDPHELGVNTSKNAAYQSDAIWTLLGRLLTT